MRQPVQVLVYPYVVVDRCVYYLLLHRLAGRTDGWQGVTGGVEDDEDVAESARRELLEETSFTPAAVRQVDFTYCYPLAERYKHLYAAGVETISEFVFAAPVERQLAPVIDPREHDDWAWFGYEQALEQLSWPNNIEALRRCQTMIMEEIV